MTNSGKSGKAVKGASDAMLGFITGARGEQGAAQVHAKQAQVEKKPARGGRQAAFAEPVVRLSVFVPAAVAQKAKTQAAARGLTLAAYVAELLEAQP